MGRLQDEQNTAPLEPAGSDDLAVERGEEPVEDPDVAQAGESAAQDLTIGAAGGLGGDDSGKARFREVEYRDVERTGPEDATDS
jgi:hypothetical protein